LGAGALNGVVVALAAALGVYAWSGSNGLALVIAAAMVGSMVIASVAGASVPMVLAALRQDPARASSVMLTTATDCMGFLSFLGLATVLKGLL
jgi:magnesium transporter